MGRGYLHVVGKGEAPFRGVETLAVIGRCRLLLIDDQVELEGGSEAHRGWLLDWVRTFLVY